MLDSLFVAVHASAATVAFVAGLAAIPSGRFLGVHRLALAVMAVALVPAVLVDWTSTDSTARAVFAGLFVLAIVIVVRGELAYRLAPARTGGRPVPAYLDHVGFTLIALADGFAVVAAIRAGAPGWLVAAVALGVVVVGHVAIRLAKRRLVLSAVASA